MNKNLILLPALLFFAMPMVVQAQFDYTVTNGSITIMDYTGPAQAVTVPATIGGLPVTSIGEWAFVNSTVVPSVMLPGSITGIGEFAFVDCSNLLSVTFSEGLATIGNGAFYDCYTLTNLIIPASVTNIGVYAFGSCIGLKSILFLGNAPTASFDAFVTDDIYTHVVACYLPGTTGWSNTFCGISAVLWNPAIQTTGPNFGPQNGQFGFDVTGNPNLPVVVEFCTNLTTPVWTPLQSLTLTNGLYHFSEPFQPDAPARYYGLGFP